MYDQNYRITIHYRARFFSFDSSFSSINIWILFTSLLPPSRLIEIVPINHPLTTSTSAISYERTDMTSRLPSHSLLYTHPIPFLITFFFRFRFQPGFRFLRILLSFYPPPLPCSSASQKNTSRASGMKRASRVLGVGSSGNSNIMGGEKSIYKLGVFGEAVGRRCKHEVLGLALDMAILRDYVCLLYFCPKSVV
ncbi:hypothetical protein B0H34DRAFT_16612 [Crassisporium funariophilum]|nr:hypothetical protein B0H34DRAFT_16612 [Crassisporium funariophilum]